jgi:hypothetical protein
VLAFVGPGAFSGLALLVVPVGTAIGFVLALVTIAKSRGSWRVAGLGGLVLIMCIASVAAIATTFIWFAASFTEGDAGLDGMDSWSSPYGSPTADERTAACEAAQNGQLPGQGYGLLRDCDLRNADFSQENLAGAQLAGARLNDANLSGANLSGADLNDADLNDADLSGADLTGAYVTYPDMNGANLSGANLTRANLTHASLVLADMTGTNLTGSDLTGADLTDANLTGAEVTGVRWGNTTCPDGTNSNDHVNTCVGYGI